MRYAGLALCVALSLTAFGCGHPLSPQEAAARRAASGNNYDLAYLECQAMAAQITGPRGSMFTQGYYMAECLKAKGY